MRARFKRFWKYFLRGLASVIDINPTPSRRIPRPMSDTEAFRQDQEAIGGDWRVVGEDLMRAAEKLRKERETKK